MELTLTPDRLTVDGQAFPWDAAAALGDLPARAAGLRAACHAITDADYRAACKRWNEAALQALGGGLFDALFPPGSDRRQAYDDAPGPLIVAVEGELADLPWELLHDGTGWPAHDRGVLRRAGRAVSGLPPAPAAELDLLVAVASPLLDPDPKLRPDDPSQPGILEVEAEWQALLAALADLKRAARARLLPQATLPALDDGLGERVAVLHLYAHGGVGRVLLEDAAGRGSRWPPASFGPRSAAPGCAWLF